METDDKTILLVDDSEDDVALTQRALKKNNIGNRMFVARDGREALDYLFGRGDDEGDKDNNNKRRRMPSVIFLDINMPKMNGFEVLKRIRADERTRLLPVLILTTSDEEKDLREGYRLGANSYICKPLDFSQFCEAVKLMGVYWLMLNEFPSGI